MFRHSLLLTFRTLKRYKGSFFINLIGLSTGLASTLLIYLWVNDEKSVDKFHEKDSRLFQVMKKSVNANSIGTYEWTPGPLAEALAAEMPEVEHAVTVVPFREGNKKGIMSVADNPIRVSAQYAGSAFFEIFSYHLLHGDKKEVLNDKHAVVISDELAIKLFHTTENIVGKTVEWNQEKLSGTYMISGVFQKPPSNATAQFDAVFTFTLYREKNTQVDNWGFGGPDTYIVLKKEADAKAFNEKIAPLLKQKDARANASQSLFIRPYSDRYLYNTYENGVQAGGRVEYVRLFSIIAGFILLIACINFMNLSTAKASRRLKEIGIKKVIGANRKALVFQFMGESMLITFFSLITAIVLVVLCLPQFNAITGKQLSLNFSSDLILTGLGIALFTGIVSGSYPALYLSGFRPAIVLKGKLNASGGETWTRKGLVIFQFVISIILIVSVIVVHKQVNFIQTKNLGYNKDNVILFKREGKLHDNLETFLNELKNIPGVVNASNLAQDLTSNGTGTSVSWEGKSPDDKTEFKYMHVNYDFIETIGIEMKEGRPFSRSFGSDSTKIIFNEAAIEAMGLKNPIGQTINQWGKEKQIIGVVKNFHFESLYEKMKPCFFILNQSGSNIIVKIKAGRERETLQQIGQYYKGFNGGLTFEYQFLDEEYQLLYAAEERVATLSQYFASVAILISCLGLFGLASFTAERRKKEIGIRKVLGSSEIAIVGLLSGEFTKLVIASVGIALPLSYVLTSAWLNNFAFSIDLQWWYFLGAALLALLISWLTVGAQALKAAQTNPVDSLRNE